MTDEKKRVVVVGAGLAGLCVAQSLAKRKDCAVKLISEKDYFLFLPRLTEYFSGSAPTERILLQLKDVWKGELVVGKAGMVNPQEKTVSLESGSVLQYDILVLALGSKVNFFGTPGKEYCYSFYSKEDADKLKAHVEQMLEAEESPGTHTFIVVGGGPTGVETAYVLNKLVKAKRPQSKVIIIERAPTILKVLPENLSKAALAQVQKAGIEIMPNVGVTNVTPLSIEVQRQDGLRETMACYTTVWAAGSAPASIPLTGVQLSQRAEIPVSAMLQLEGHPEVFSLGDVAATNTPKTAQAALQQAKHASENIANFIEGKPLTPFSLVDKGTIIALEENTVGLAYGKLISGFVARTIRDRYYRYVLGFYG